MDTRQHRTPCPVAVRPGPTLGHPAATEVTVATKQLERRRAISRGFFGLAAMNGCTTSLARARSKGGAASGPPPRRHGGKGSAVPGLRLRIEVFIPAERKRWSDDAHLMNCWMSRWSKR